MRHFNGERHGKYLSRDMQVYESMFSVVELFSSVRTRWQSTCFGDDYRPVLYRHESRTKGRILFSNQCQMLSPSLVLVLLDSWVICGCIGGVFLSPEQFEIKCERSI